MSLFIFTFDSAHSAPPTALFNNVYKLLFKGCLIVAVYKNKQVRYLS